MKQSNHNHEKPTTSTQNADSEGMPGFTPKLPDPFEVQRAVAAQILGLQMAKNLF
jgi:hypothetical protein